MKRFNVQVVIQKTGRGRYQRRAGILFVNGYEVDSRFLIGTTDQMAEEAAKAWAARITDEEARRLLVEHQEGMLAALAEVEKEAAQKRAALAKLDALLNAP